MDQRTEEWFAKRAGKFTASRVSDLMAKTKSGPSASRGNLLTLLAVERLTGTCVETFTNGAMQRGTDLEPEARAAYAFDRGVAVIEVAFIAAEGLPNAGCSPDGLVGDDGLVEIKCPASMAKHMDYLRHGSHAKEYHWQLMHQILCTGRQWVDVASYDPRFPEGLQMAVVRVKRDDAAISELSEAIREADAEVEAMVAEMGNLRAAA